MVIITAEDLSKTYGDRTLFEGVSFGISSEDKIGLVGANGAGKSTLLRLIIGTEPSDTGRRAVSREAHIEFMSQRPDLNPEFTALEQVLHEGPEAFEVVRLYEAACRALEEDPTNEARMESLTKLSTRMDQVSGWTIEGEAKATLGFLGIKDPNQKIGTMSGGQRKRVAIARALVRPSDLLVMDEPTNHLDVDTVRWLESHLAARQGALLLITHDRYFLDRVTTTIFELAEGTVFRHSGNYSAYLESRAARHAEANQREHKRAQLAKRELAWLRRSPAARTSKSRSRVERAHALIDADHSIKTSKAEIDAVSSRLGKKIMEFHDVTKSYDDKTVVRDFTYVFPRRDRVGIIGPNGAGKSTLLNLMTGRLEPTTGTIEVGDTVVFGYYDQESEELDEEMRVYDYIGSVSNHIETSQGALSASQMLDKFLFPPSRQYAPISKLSGGERRRLYLLRVLMEQPNVLILDEPTNDLDIETLTVLEDFLESFRGVLIVVSHDRYFLDRTVEHLLVFGENATIEEFPGTYSIWLEESERRAREAAQQDVKPQAPRPAPKSSQPDRLSYKEVRELEALRVRIEELETRLEEIQDEMVANASDFSRLGELQKESQAAEEELETSLERWMELEERS